jgi:hypothetical protein
VELLTYARVKKGGGPGSHATGESTSSAIGALHGFCDLPSHVAKGKGTFVIPVGKFALHHIVYLEADSRVVTPQAGILRRFTKDSLLCTFWVHHSIYFASWQETPGFRRHRTIIRHCLSGYVSSWQRRCALFYSDRSAVCLRASVLTNAPQYLHFRNWELTLLKR